MGIMSDLQIRPIDAVYSQPYKNIEYQQTVVKVDGNNQTETVFTYDKYGRLIETIVRSHEIGSV